MRDDEVQRMRAVGVRQQFDELPASLRDWAQDYLGAVVVAAQGQLGGMSPGAAVRLLADNGARVFLKAVGDDLNPDTLQLFRHEITVLSRVQPVSYRAALIDSYDDGHWVGLLLEDVDGRHPDLSQAEDHLSVRRVVERQVVELTPAPHGLQITTVRQTAERWLTRWQDIVRNPVAYLPEWACRHITQLHERVSSLPARLEGDCHFDVRDDNLLIRTDGTAVIVDWGMARIGPAWVDPVLLELQGVGFSTLDRPLVSLQANYGVPPDTITDFLLAFGGSQAWSALRRPHPGLPTMAAFCREDAQRLLERARRRLDELSPQAGKSQ